MGFPDPVNEVAARVVAGGVVLMATAAIAFDLRWMTAYPAREGLAPPGGLARFAVSGAHLATVSVQQDGLPAHRARAALLAGLNEDLTTFRHNLSTHLTTLTSFALATANPAD